MSILNFICNTSAYKNLPEDQKSIFCKYIGIAPALEAKEENCSAVLSFAEENGIALVTAKSLVRFICEDINDIKLRFETYKSAGYERIVINNPELIRFNAKEVLSRIEQCLRAGKGIEIDGRFAEFLFDDIQWKTVSANLLLPGASAEKLEEGSKFIEVDKLHSAVKEPSKIGRNNLESTLFSNDQYDLDSEQFERYLQVTELLKNVRYAIYTVDVGDNVDAKISSDMVISKLIGSANGSNFTDNDIIKACLFYCNGETDLMGIDAIIKDLTLNQENKRGL